MSLRASKGFDDDILVLNRRDYSAAVMFVLVNQQRVLPRQAEKFQTDEITLRR